MAWYNFKFGKQKTELPKNIKRKEAFSTPFMTIGKGNLSAPSINQYYSGNNYVLFGTDNLYPQLLNQIYFQSPIHSSCIDFITNSIIGGSYEWKMLKTSMKNKVDILSFEKLHDFKRLAFALTRDWVMHSRVCVIVKRTDNDRIVLKRVDPSTVRWNNDLSNIVYSDDWSKGYYNVTEYEKYDPFKKQPISMYIMCDNTPGQDIYPLPSYISCLNWAFLDGEQSVFHKSNMQNSVFPSIVIRSPKKFQSDEEQNEYIRVMQSNAGSLNSGRAVIVQGDGFDDCPEFQPIPVNANDKMFLETAKEIKNNICIAHKINPSILGVKTAGQLGNVQEIAMSWIIFEKTVVMTMRNQVQDILNDLIHITGITDSIEINVYQIVDESIIKTSVKNSPINENVNKQQ